MDEQLIASFFEILQRSRCVAIVLREQPSVDAAAAALGWQQLLATTGHEVTIIAGNGLPSQVMFLPGAADVRSDLLPTSLTVTVATGDVTVSKVRYEIGNGSLQVHIQPANGSLNNPAVTATPGERPFDLLLSIGCPTRESWGGVFERNREQLLHCPTVALDIHPGHQRYGQLNLLDIASPSLCATSHNIWSKHQPDLAWLTADVATCWYAGIVAATDRFSIPQVTPSVLASAGQLLAAGANRDAVMSNLYKRRSVNEVRLWGTALATLDWDEATRLAWCTITRNDVIHSGIDDIELGHLLREVSLASPHADVTMLFYERGPEETVVSAAVPGAIDALLLLRQYQPLGDADLATVTVAASLPNCRNQVLDSIRITLAAARGSSTVLTPNGP